MTTGINFNTNGRGNPTGYFGGGNWEGDYAVRHGLRPDPTSPTPPAIGGYRPNTSGYHPVGVVSGSVRDNAGRTLAWELACTQKSLSNAVVFSRGNNTGSGSLEGNLKQVVNNCAKWQETLNKKQPSPIYCDLHGEIVFENFDNIATLARRASAKCASDVGTAISLAETVSTALCAMRLGFNHEDLRDQRRDAVDVWLDASKNLREALAAT